jgi:hypothetical protein
MLKEYDIRWLPGEQIIVEVIHDDFNIHDDTVPGNLATIAILDTATCAVPYILDLTELRITFADMVSVLVEITRGASSPAGHPYLMELIMVTQNGIIRVAASAMAQSQYGRVKTRVFTTMDEALSYARSVAPSVVPVST